jgi:hypothetical protein
VFLRDIAKYLFNKSHGVLERDTSSVVFLSDFREQLVTKSHCGLLERHIEQGQRSQ